MRYWLCFSVKPMLRYSADLPWTQIENEIETSFQIRASRLSKWHLRFFWRIFLRLDSFLACSVWVDINVNVSFNENVRQFSVRFIKLLHHCIRMSSLRQVESVIGFDCTLQRKWRKSNCISGRFLSQVFFYFFVMQKKVKFNNSSAFHEYID